jgi:Mrp family chromosome partitioning ATPase
LRRFWWIVVLFTIGGAVIAGLPQPEQAADSVTTWNANHTLLVSNSTGTNSVFTDPQAFNQLQLFATTGEVPQRAAEAIDYNGPPAALAAQVTVTSDQQSGALRISTTQSDPDSAVEYVDAIADELVRYLSERQDQLREDRLNSTLARLDDLETEINEVERQVLIAPADPEDPLSVPEEDPVARAQLDALSRQYSVVFEQFDSLQADSGQLVLTTLERAQPIAIEETGLGAPRSRVGRAALGALAGAAVGFGVALLLARADRRIRTGEQAAELLGLEPNAIIPKVKRHRTGELTVTPGRHDPLSDSYRTLRSLIAFLDAGNDTLGDRGSITVVVSPGPADGKTSVTANVASALVESGERTVAVNTDFRRPTISDRLGVVNAEPAGLSLHDIEHAPLELVLAPGEDPGLAMLDLSGMRGNSPGDLARVTARLLPRVADVADAVIVDTSPIGATAEVLEVLPAADNVVMVVRLGHTTAQSARRSIEMVRALSSGNLLLVLVGGDTGDSGKYYYYYSRPAPAPQTGRFGRRKNRDAIAPTEETTVGS